jgi:hypothetical protein
MSWNWVYGDLCCFMVKRFNIILVGQQYIYDSLSSYEVKTVIASIEACI